MTVFKCFDRICLYGRLMLCACLILTAATAVSFEIVAGPYLQNPTDTSMTVMWITDTNSTATVEYGSGENLSSKAISTTDGQIDANTTIHRVTISGLKPATAYTYRAASTEITKYEPYKVTYGQTISSPAYTFKTLEAKKANGSFLVFNDVHDRFAALAGRFEAANQPPCELIFLNGDIINDPSSEEQIIQKTLKPVADLFAAQTPFLCVRGNHETRGAFARSLKNYLDLPDNRYYYSLQQGPVYFIVLDSGEDKEDSNPAYNGLNVFDAYRSEQAEWLKKEIKKPAFKKAPFRIVLSHIPLFGRDKAHGTLDCREKWAALLNKGRIDLHLSGHIHQFEIVEPVAGQHNYPVVIGGGPKDENGTVIRVDATTKKLDVTVMDNNGSIIAKNEIKRRSGWPQLLNW